MVASHGNARRGCAGLALPYRRRVVFYAVVSDEIEQVIEFFRTPAEAEAMLEAVHEDEPGWREILYVEPIELVTGQRELTEAPPAPSSLGCSGGCKRRGVIRAERFSVVAGSA